MTFGTSRNLPRHWGKTKTDGPKIFAAAKKRPPTRYHGLAAGTKKIAHQLGDQGRFRCELAHVRRKRAGPLASRGQFLVIRPTRLRFRKHDRTKGRGRKKKRLDAPSLSLSSLGRLPAKSGKRLIIAVKKCAWTGLWRGGPKGRQTRFRKNMRRIESKQSHRRKGKNTRARGGNQASKRAGGAWRISASTPRAPFALRSRLLHRRDSR